MIDFALAGWIVLALVALFFGALYAGLETGVYTLNRIRLAVRAAHGDPAAVRIRRESEDPNRTLAVLLVGTNASHYVASFCLAAIFHRLHMDDWTLIIVEAAVLAPLLFVFAEILPKDLFRTHTDHWTYRLSGILVLSRWLFVAAGLLPLLRVTGALALRLLGGDPQGAVSARQHISQMIKEGGGSGVLTESQTTLADRALAVRSRTVGTEMIPWTEVVAVGVKADHLTREAVMRRHSFTRMPVVDRSGRVVGVLSSIDALLSPDEPTEKLMTVPLAFPPTTPLREALRVMRSKRQTMAIAVEPHGDKPRGLVTLKDLVEPITGELGAW